MGRQETEATKITPEQVQEYLRRTGHPDAVIESLAPLGMSTQADLKAYGYGHPLHATYTAAGERGEIVIRTMSPDPFGHNRRSARAETLLLGFDTFNDIPRHIRALDIGAFDDDGALLPMGRGEFFLVTDFVEGELYAQDLHALQNASDANANDLDRATALAEYLAELHSVKAEPDAYTRTIRDTVGGGEGIFGLCDSYPSDCEVAPLDRLRAIEREAVAWRWKLHDKTGRARRTHGDFHPFNILFRDGTDFSVLDCSRGGAGEPADDLTCLSINFVFFALTQRAEFDGALRALWDRFWTTYVDVSGDREVLEVVAPFFAWRTLVLASPVWYPNIDDRLRDRLLRFTERLLGGEPFAPDTIDDLLS
ncbi:MAG: aminoglycoside phosphotransferase family protein [Myxococcota bacterium]